MEIIRQKATGGLERDITELWHEDDSAVVVHLPEALQAALTAAAMPMTGWVSL